jgi:hypothetical protein
VANAEDRDGRKLKPDGSVPDGMTVDHDQIITHGHRPAAPQTADAFFNPRHLCRVGLSHSAVRIPQRVGGHVFKDQLGNKIVSSPSPIAQLKQRFLSPAAGLGLFV